MYSQSEADKDARIAQLTAELAEARRDSERLLKLGGMLAHRPHLAIWVDSRGKVRITDEDTDGKTFSGTGASLPLAIDAAARGAK